MRTLITILFCLFASIPAFGQWIDDPTIDAAIQKGISATYDIQFDAATQAFESVIKARPEHPAGYFFTAMVDWWRILINIDDESQDQAFFQKLDRVIDMCDRLLDKNERDLTGLFFKGGAIGFRGRLLAMRKSWVRAAGDGKEALPIVMDAARLGKNNPDINLGTGIYNYYAAVLPEKYSVLKPLMLFLPRGDKNKGLRQLKHAAEKARYANWEAAYFLVQAYGSYENLPWAGLPYAKRLCKRFPNNPVFQRSLGKLYVRLGDWQNVGRVYTDIMQRAAKNQTGYSTPVQREALYYLGYEAMVRRDFSSAMKHLLKCDELSRSIDAEGPSGYMVMANLRMGMLYDEIHQRSFALKQYDKILRMDDYNGSHDLALQYKKTPYEMQ